MKIIREMTTIAAMMNAIITKTLAVKSTISLLYWLKFLQINVIGVKRIYAITKIKKALKKRAFRYNLIQLHSAENWPGIESK